jgi:enoyl-[acyl-carrier protein] reductase II
MLRTPVCDLLDMKVPIMQAAIWPATAPKLVAAVSEAGGLGSIGSIFESAESVQRQIARVREITPRPFAVNHVVPLLDEAAFRATLEAKPTVVSFALGYPGDLVERAHDAGAKVIHQIHTVAQARKEAELGVDVIIAQGSEAGGQGMALGVGAMALLPQVADAVDPIPVLAAGGEADGRGLAAALVLGAQGANVGTRFLASEEASAEEGWKRTILQTESEDVVRFEAWEGIFPPAGVAPTRRCRACCVRPSSRSGWDAPKRPGGKRSGCGMRCSRRSGGAPPTSWCPSAGRRQVWSTTSCRLER